MNSLSKLFLLAATEEKDREAGGDANCDLQATATTLLKKEAQWQAFHPNATLRYGFTATARRRAIRGMRT